MAAGLMRGTLGVSGLRSVGPGGAPTAAERDSDVALLDNGTYTQASLGVLAAQIALNAQSVEIVGLADTGIAFTPAG